MKKIIVILIIVASAIGAGIWWYSSNKNNDNNKSDYQAEKSAININIADNNNTNINTNTSVNTNTENNKNETNPSDLETETTVNKTETEISSFSTKIYNKDEERQNNISITCNAINNKEIEPGEIFSFCDTVGKATTSKGYQEADIYINGEKKQGLGGGNCQVSTTLYNAVTKITELEIVERHKHSGKVPYIKDGKDAAVAYGSYDFKFKNNTENTIKIIMEKTANNITAKIIKIA